MRLIVLVTGTVVALVAVAVLVVKAAHVEDPNALRNPGEDCVSCHRLGGKAPRSLFTASGSIFRAGSGEPRETGAAGVELSLEDSAGRTVELVSNAAGNFWSKEELLYPVQVTVRARPGAPARRGPADRCAHGNCNQCHSYERPGAEARGRLVSP
jgi:hypothetical protein